MDAYIGITHQIPMEQLAQWEQEHCSHGWHAWDEVVTVDSHYLYCDACGMIVYITGGEACTE